ncbi:hypothetical protein LX32DRAFT_7921 [Colletotrichum zoysiae]|uniref:Secreted protein n=1 Tax=Colletotrichum zoysiae TaxID=1216348 RepID=A0AAD9HTJ6_9PEZI|nr:hypothetical protein LX32DRAFT_7921 [Colletotrichum zoysiae]
MHLHYCYNLLVCLGCWLSFLFPHAGQTPPLLPHYLGIRHRATPTALGILPFRVVSSSRSSSRPFLSHQRTTPPPFSWFTHSFLPCSSYRKPRRTGSQSF